MPSAAHGKKKESYKHKNHVDEELAAGLTALLPFLTQLEILPQTANVTDIDVDALKNLAGRWNYDLVDPKSHHHITFSELIKALSAMAERIAVRKADEKAAIKAAKLKRWEAFQENNIDPDKEQPSRPTSSMFEDDEEMDPIKALADDPGDLTFSHISVKFPRNYFGLPTHALQRTSNAVVYQARAAEKEEEPAEDFTVLYEHSHQGDYDDQRKSRGVEKGAKGLDRSDTAGTTGSRPQTGENKNSVSQKKVANALLKMASNDSMLHHFVNKGGIEAIYKLAFESNDSEVLSLCASCLTTATMTPKWHAILLEKQLMSNICSLSEKGDEHVKFECSRAITLLSLRQDLHTSLAKSGILIALQNLLNSKRGDILSYAALSASNVAPIFFHGVSGNNSPEAEAALRVILAVSRKLDVVSDYDIAFFISTLFSQISRIEKYQGLFVEEGGLTLLLAILDRRDESDVTDRCSEAFVNLSLLKKNQREVAASGVAFQLPKLLGGKNVSPKSRAFCLMMVGNLLNAGYLHDKIANEDTVNSILKMFDPVSARQFMAVGFVLSQITHTKQSMDLIVECGGVFTMCKQLNAVSVIGRDMHEDPAKYKDADGTSQSTQLKVLRDGLGYIWDILANIAIDPDHRNIIAKHPEIIHQIEAESKKGLEVPSAVEGNEQEAEEKFVDTMQPDILSFLLNFTCIPELDKYVESSLLLKLVLSVRLIFAKALGPSSWMKKIRMDTVTILVNLSSRIKFSRKCILGEDLIKQIEYKGVEDPVLSLKYVELISMISIEENCCVNMIDQGAQKLLVSLLDTKSSICKDLIAAAFHNMSLKRAVLVPGQLAALLEISKGTKSSRLLWITRTIANLSAKNKPRTALAKDRLVIAELAKLMRGGCDFAEKVQKYCAFAICNIMSSHVDKSIFEELIKNRTISDIVVVTLLRINSAFTKEALSKALFNFLSRNDYREVMVGQGGKDDIDLLAAILELAKIEMLELLAISIRTIFNISCEVSNPVYAKKLDALGVPQLLIARVTHNKFINGARANNEIKLMCSMAMANLSFNKTLAKHMILDKSFADACVSIYKLRNDEALYCVNTVLFNISFLEECVEMHDSPAVNVLIDTLSGTLINCTQLAVAALTNLSLHDAFYPQLVKIDEKTGVNSMMGMVTILGSPQLAMSVKLDCLHFIYNLVSVYPPSRAAAIEADCVPALAKFLKSVDGNDTLCIIGRIITDICTEAIQYISKLLNDGIMPVLLKMSKLEIPTIKYDISRAIYNLTTVKEPFYTMKVLKWDATEILFWLTLHDCLDLYDPVKQHCVRAIRNFTLIKNEALFLCNEDRFVTVVKALITKTTHLDVLSQVAAVLYNVVAIDECRTLMLKRGVIDLIFDVARCNVDTVRHICSACLHMCPDDMPDMENPEVLSLVMCLLEADGDMFGELALRATEQLEYLLGNTAIGTAHHHDGTDFSGHWVTLVCDVDANFSPGEVELSLEGMRNIATKPMAVESMGVEPHTILTPETFNDFVGGHSMESERSQGEEGIDRREIGVSYGKGESELEINERMEELTINTPDHAPSTESVEARNRKNEHTDMNRSIASSKFNEAFDDTSTQNDGDNYSLATSALTGEYHTNVRPIQRDEIQFPRLIPKQMPDDSLGAIKSSLYKKTNPSNTGSKKNGRM